MKKQYKLYLLLIALFTLSIQINTVAQPIGQPQPDVPDDWKNDLWLNTHYREMSVGDTYQIVARRVPEIVESATSPNVTLPTFHYTVVRGNSVTVDENGQITANSLGASIIEVKYDEKEAYGNTYPAVSPINITYLAVDVVDPAVIASTSLTTDITTRMYDTHYFLGESTYLSFNVNATGADSIAVKCNDFKARVKNNNYSVRLQNRANIVEIVAYNQQQPVRKLYYVIDARKIKLNIENKSNPGKNFEAGDKAHVSFKGITLPVYKLATIYNPQFESSWGGKFARVYFDNEQLGEVKTNVNVTQYDLADNNTIEIDFQEEGNYIFKNGRIHEAWWGSPLGTEQDMTGPGQPNLDAPTEESDFSSFPNFGISVGYQPALFDETKLFPETQEYADASAFTPYQDLTEYFTSGSFSFKNISTNWGGNTFSWYGTAVSNRTDAESMGGVWNQFNSAAGGDIDGTGNYAVVYDANSGGMGMGDDAIITFTNKDYPDGKLVQGLYITNNTYATNSMENGDQFAKKFGGASGNDPDYFRLTIRGIDKDNNATGTVDYYLADYRFENNTRDYIRKDWRWVDLSSLGTVTKLQFELHSSDVGDYGMNTPSYFCVDNINAPRLVVKKDIEDVTIENNKNENEIDLTEIFNDPQNSNLEYAITYNSNPELVSTNISGNSLTLANASSETGTAEIAVKAMSNKMAAETHFTVTVTTATGVAANNNLPKLVLTPNPTVDHFSVNADGTLTIYSVNGVKVKEAIHYTNGTNIDVTDLSTGVYFVKVNNQTLKLIKR